MQQVTIQAITVTSLAAELGIPEIEHYLRQANVYLRPKGDHLIVDADDVAEFVRTAIKGFYGNGALTEAEAADIDVASAPADSADDFLWRHEVTRWANKRRYDLERNPELVALMHRFVTYLMQNEPTTRVRQNSWTLSLNSPHHAGISLKPRPRKGLYLEVTRSTLWDGYYVSSTADFDMGLQFFRQYATDQRIEHPLLFHTL